MPTHLTVPISEKAVRALHIGDQVLVTGVIFTGRDAAHKYIVETFIKHKCPDGERVLYDVLKPGLKDGVIYHCGPVVRKREDHEYQFVAAGPTTSIREEPYEAAVIEHFGLRGIIGRSRRAHIDHSEKLRGQLRICSSHDARHGITELPCA